jgi:hypothetical protein
MNNKYEQLIEHIINDEETKARDIFHTIVVEKSRDIYESLIDEEDLSEVGGNEVEGLVDEITVDEQGIAEEDEAEDHDDEAMDMDDDAMDADVEADAEEADVEDRVVDLEDALDELKAEFDALMAGEAEEVVEPEMDGAEEMEVVDQEEFMEEKEEVTENVDLIAVPTDSQSGDVLIGDDGTVPVNTTSPNAGENDMGGTPVNFDAGGTSEPNGQTPNSSENPDKKMSKEEFQNVPAKKGLAKMNKPAKKDANQSGTQLAAADGTTPIQTKSTLKPIKA